MSQARYFQRPRYLFEFHQLLINSNTNVSVAFSSDATVEWEGEVTHIMLIHHY